MKHSLEDMWLDVEPHAYATMDLECGKGTPRADLVIVLVDRRDNKARVAVGPLAKAIPFVRQFGVKPGHPAYAWLTTPAPAGETRVIGRLADLSWDTATVPSEPAD